VAEAEETAVPAWVKEYAIDVRLLLGIDDGWHIIIKMVDEPSGRRIFNGSASYDSAYLNAQIELANDLEDNAEGRRVILHELFHVALAQMYQAAEYAFGQLPKKRRRLVRKVYNDAEEQFIQRATRAMQRNIKPEEE
jgi:hypothetical protein